MEMSVLSQKSNICALRLPLLTIKKSGTAGFKAGFADRPPLKRGIKRRAQIFKLVFNLPTSRSPFWINKWLDNVEPAKRGLRG